MTSRILKYMMIAVVGLSLVAISAPAFAADVTGKTSTQTLPTQTNTQTAPMPSNTQSVPLPSKIQTTIPPREYQQVDKPPVKTLDIPDYDLAGELRIERVRTSIPQNGKRTIAIDYRVALMNKGKKKVMRDIPYRIRKINVTNQTLFEDHTYHWDGDVSSINHEFWTVERPRTTGFRTNSGGAPDSINDVKMIVDIDPNNTFGEARNDRGNNRCIVTTW